jgi:hypothetical protein
MLVLSAFFVLVAIEFLVLSIGTNYLFTALEQGLRALFLVSTFVLGGISDCLWMSSNPCVMQHSLPSLLRL